MFTPKLMTKKNFFQTNLFFEKSEKSIVITPSITQILGI